MIKNKNPKIFLVLPSYIVYDAPNIDDIYLVNFHDNI